MVRLGGAAAVAALALLGAGVEAPAQAPAPPAALAPLEPGLWEFKDIGGSSPPSRICITDLRQLLQPLQPTPLCRQFTSESAGDRAAVAYDCAARGQGRTSLRVETARLVQIDSQGISGGRPFAVRYEARRIGACTAASR
jgi:hypothetical protein